MKKEHQVFSIAEENPVVPGCTISGQLMRGVTVFSLAEGTDISAESYPIPILQVQLSGSLVLDMGAPAGETVKLSAGEAVAKPAGKDIGVAAKEDSVYL
jgi:quercetin dioxygenase-like cupin family protein